MGDMGRGSKAGSSVRFRLRGRDEGQVWPHRIPQWVLHCFRSQRDVGATATSGEVQRRSLRKRPPWAGSHVGKQGTRPRSRFLRNQVTRRTQEFKSGLVAGGGQWILTKRVDRPEKWGLDQRAGCIRRTQNTIEKMVMEKGGGKGPFPIWSWIGWSAVVERLKNEKKVSWGRNE